MDSRSVGTGTFRVHGRSRDLWRRLCTWSGTLSGGVPATRVREDHIPKNSQRLELLETDASGKGLPDGGDIDEGPAGRSWSKGLRKTHGERKSPHDPGEIRFDHGSASFPFILLLVFLATGALTLLGLQLRLRSQVSLQFRLDRCVSERSSELARVMNVIEQGNSLIQATKVAALAAAIPTEGASIHAGKTVCSIIAAKQDAELLRWQWLQMKWIAKRGCDGKRDGAIPLPSLGWTRPAPDPLGPAPLERQKKDSPFRIGVWNEKTTSFARVEALDRKKNRWKARWTSGTGLL